MQFHEQFPRSNRPLKLLALGVATLAICSCAENTPVKSLPIEEKFSPVFAKDTIAENPATETTPVRAFLDSSFFMGASINFEEAFAAEQLQAVKWSELERTLGKWLGPQNAELKKIRRIWFLVDQSFADFMSPDANKKPMDAMAFVVESKTKIDASFWKSFPNPPTAVGPGSMGTLATIGLKVVQVDDYHIAIASQEIAKRLQGKTTSGKLRMMANEESLARTVSIFVDPKPLSGLLNTMAQVGKSFGASDTTQPLLAIEQIEISGDLTDDDLFRFTVSADDTKAIDELASQLSNGLGSSAGGSSGSALAGMLGGGPASGGFGSPRRGAQLYEFTSSNSVAAFLEDVQKNSLAETVKTDKQVELSVKKTDTFNALLVDLINDLQALISQTQRTSNLAAIAKAIGEYEQKNGLLPHDGSLTSNPATDPKFSWRVAILPQLGYQALYDRIDFSQDWNSEKNRTVAGEMPDVFANTVEKSKTSICIAKGDRFVYLPEDDGGSSLKSINDARNRTAIVVELAPTRAVDWMAPDARLEMPIRADDFGMPNEAGFLFIDAEFRPRGIRKSASNIEAILTTNGKEKIDRQDLILIETAKETLEKLKADGVKDE